MSKADVQGSGRRQGTGQDGEAIQSSSGGLGQGRRSNPSIGGSHGSSAGKDGEHDGEALSLSNKISTISFFLTVDSQANEIALGCGR